MECRWKKDDEGVSMCAYVLKELLREKCGGKKKKKKKLATGRIQK